MQHYAPHTVRAYRQDLAGFSSWFASSTGDTFNPQAVTPLDIRESKRHLLNQRARPATINRRLASLSTFFRWARATGLVTGNTLVARSMPGILPKLTIDETLDVTRIYSVADALSPGEPLVRHRPFRAPHHTVSYAGLVGGGRWPKPGEISLAHRGVCFFWMSCRSLERGCWKCCASR